MPVINVTVKWSGKKFENIELGNTKKYFQIKEDCNKRLT